MQKKSRGGFSLIELIMILLVVVILAVIALSPKSYLQEIRIRQAALKIKSDIRYAQSYALKSEERTKVDFDVAAKSYSIYVESSPGNWSLMSDPLAKSNFIVTFGTGDYSGVDITQTNFDGTDYDLVFDAAGRPYSCNPSGGATSLLSSLGTVTLTGGVSVAVEPNTGKIQ